MAARTRKRFTPDAEIDRLICAARRCGLTPGAVTFHADGSVTVAEASPGAASNDAEMAYQRRRDAKAASRQ